MVQSASAPGGCPAGVVEPFSSAYREPSSVACVAIDAALTAVNPVSHGCLNEARPIEVMLFGVPGFFAVRFLPEPFQPHQTFQGGTPGIRELVQYFLEDTTVNCASTAPAALKLARSAFAPVARLPVLELISVARPQRHDARNGPSDPQPSRLKSVSFSN